jgi:hypothetical protein
MQHSRKDTGRGPIIKTFQDGGKDTGRGPIITTFQDGRKDTGRGTIITSFFLFLPDYFYVIQYTPSSAS